MHRRENRHPHILSRVLILLAILCLLTLAGFPLTRKQDVSSEARNVPDRETKDTVPRHFVADPAEAGGIRGSKISQQEIGSLSLTQPRFSKINPEVFTLLPAVTWSTGEEDLNKTESISTQDPRRGKPDQGEELDGPEVIRDRVRDYLRRHGMANGFDPNHRLQLVRREYEKKEIEKANRLLQPMIVGTNWVSLGPTNGAGRMTAISVHPTMSGTVYVGAAGGGLWKSTDAGVLWTPLTDSINDLFVGAVAVAPSSPNVIYLGTGEGNTFTPGIGLLKSTDGGNTWQFPSSVIASSFYKISVHPANPQELVIGTASGGFRSTNGGQNWTTVIPSSQVTDIVRHSSNPQILYATTKSTQVLKSTDGGASWANKSSGVPVQTLDRLAIAISVSNPLILYVAGATQDGVAHIYKTTDGGEAWSELLGISTNSSPSIRQYFAVYNQSWYDNTIVISPSDPNVVIAGGVTYVKSTDGGATWSSPFSSGGYPHVDVHDLQYQGSTLYIANDGGIWSSTDNAQSATDRNSTLVTRQYYTVANDPINRNRIFGGTQDNGTDRRPESGGTAWTDIIGGDGFDCAVNPYAPEIFYGTIQYGEIHRTRSAGTTGYFYNKISPNYPSGEPGAGPFFTILTMDPNNPSILYTGSYRVWKSVDGGDSWAPLPTTTTDGSTWPNYGLFKIAVARSDSRILMASHGGTVFRSTNSGTSWVSASSGLPYCNGIDIDPQNPNIAYAASPYSGVYMTANGGGTWIARSSGLPLFSTHVVRVDPTDTNTLFCGTDVGVYKSTDRGLNWAKFGTGLPSVSIYDLSILNDGSALRAATHGRGMWELQIPPSGNNPPTATITDPSSNLTVTRGTSFTFQGAVSDPDSGDTVAGTWFFGDTGEISQVGSGSSTLNHTFSRAGVFATSLTARDSHGALANANRSITVTETFDSCVTPMVIPGNGPFPWSLTANKEGGTKDPSDPPTPCLSNQISHTFWFEFTPTSSAIYQFATTDTYVSDVLSLWKGPACGPYTAVPSGCSYYGPLSLYVAAGTTVRVMLSSWLDSDNGTVTLTVTKGAECTFSLGSTSQNFSASGGEGTITYNTQSGCGTPPTTSNASWLQPIVTSASTLRYIIAANYDSQSRTGTMTIAGQTFTVEQGAATTACVPRPSGLVAWWQGEGNALDQTGVNNGTLINNITFGGGKIGGGFLGDYSNNAGVVEVPNSSSLALYQSMTFEGWLKLNSHNGTVIERRTGDYLWSYQVWTLSDGRLYFTIWYDGHSGSGVYSDPLPLGQFVHFAASLDDGTGQVKMYINGSLVRQFTTAQRPYVTSGAKIYIGNLDGITDELSVYDRALTASEIQGIYNAGIAATGAAGKCPIALPPLTITSVISPAGRTSGGQQVVLTGSFAGLSTLSLGGVSASWFYTNGSSDTNTITVTTPAHAVGAVQIDLTPTSGSAYSKSSGFAYLPTVFTDNTLLAAVTIAKAQHIVELRQAVDAMRAVAGLTPAPWTDPALSPFSMSIKAVHIMEVRTYLNDAASRLGYSTSAYTDPTLSTGFSIKRVHIEELRQRIRTIAG